MAKRCHTSEMQVELTTTLGLRNGMIQTAHLTKGIIKILGPLTRSIRVVRCY